MKPEMRTTLEAFTLIHFYSPTYFLTDASSNYPRHEEFMYSNTIGNVYLSDCTYNRVGKQGGKIALVINSVTRLGYF